MTTRRPNSSVRRRCSIYPTCFDAALAGGPSRGARESLDLSGDAANDDEASKPTKTRGARGA
jgi:hypothetical protein